MKQQDFVASIVDQLETMYDRSVDHLRQAIASYVTGRTPPDAEWRAAGAFAYPELRIRYAGEFSRAPVTRAFARLSEAGVYASSIARPRLFRSYLIEQLDHLCRDYDVEISVARSASEIPYPYVIEDSGLDIGEISAAELSHVFPSTELANIGDEVVDGTWLSSGTRPLALFDGPRTDFSLARLRHYTGTSPEQFQRFVLFTNYVRYVDEFVSVGLEALRTGGSRFTGLAVPGAVYADGNLDGAEAEIAASQSHRRQMPAYHLMAEDGGGVTLINIGVGPSNAKTICDHVAVLRPDVWIMIGHCGGLRASQTIGDYVLAHAYLRDDHVLDDVLPAEIPLPAIAEVQQALFQAALKVTGEDEDSVKRRLRTGTIVTTDDRNWELRYSTSRLRLNQTRAVAIDMESATVAAQGYRFRVPYGTLLCVSDKPLHGELKLPRQANAFYERAVSQHLRVGIEALGLLKLEGERLHSRKLRSFDEPPLR